MKPCAAILMVALVVPAEANADYVGKVTAVVDGDTFKMQAENGKVRVRICGIDLASVIVCRRFGHSRRAIFQKTPVLLGF